MVDLRIASKSWFQQSFNNFIEELRRGYEGFFEDLDTGLPPSELKHPVSLPQYGVSVEPVSDRELGEHYEDETLREVEESGMEAIAVYIPYHLTRSWGIYIFVEKLNGLASFVSRRLSITFDDAFQSCERAVLEHECFHFHMEYSATIVETIAEVARRGPIYLPYFQASRPYDKDEEAIANAWMLTSRSKYIRKARFELQRICDASPSGYKDYKRYMIGNRIDYSRVRGFWASRFLGSTKFVLLPVRLEMPGSYGLIPIYYVQTLKAPELTDALYFISNNLRIEDVVKKLKKILPDDIVEASASGIRLKTGRVIHIHYHPREGGRRNLEIINEVADATGKDRKWLKERLRKTP
jgi:hypothetical protein